MDNKRDVIKLHGTDEKEYVVSDYIHFVRQQDGSKVEVDSKGGSKRSHPLHEITEVAFRDFLKIKLNTKGESVPFNSKNVINVSRYLFWYWTPLIGSDAVATYILLNEYCSETTDFCYPKMTELAGRLNRTAPTVKKAIKILEENNFIIMVNRLMKKQNRRETSPVFRVRQTVPLLSKEQYELLPDKLKEKHDEFMENNISLEVSQHNYNHDKTVTELLSSGSVLITKRKEERMMRALMLSQKNETVCEMLTKQELLFNDTVHELMKSDESELTKPSYDSFFFDSVFRRNFGKYNQVEVICSEGTKEMLGGHAPHYFEQISRILEEVSGVEPFIEILSHDEFIER